MLTSAIADDIHGLANLCLMPTRESLRRGQIIGLQDKDGLADAKAIRIALKSISTPPVPAVEISLVTVILVRAGKAEQVLFKSCFGTTDAGTIGVVGETLEVTALKVDPEICAGTGRTRNVSGPDLALVLKSDNCRSDDIFLKAWPLLETEPADAVFRPRQSRSCACGARFGQQSPCGPVGKSSPSNASTIPNITGELL